MGFKLYNCFIATYVHTVLHCNERADGFVLNADTYNAFKIIQFKLNYTAAKIKCIVLLLGRVTSPDMLYHVKMSLDISNLRFLAD